MFRTLIRFFLLWDRKMIGIAVGVGMSLHQLDARGCSQCGCNGRQNSNNGLQDFLPKFFLVHDFLSYEL